MLILQINVQSASSGVSLKENNVYYSTLYILMQCLNMSGKNYIKSFYDRRVSAWTWILNPLVTSFSTYFCFKSNFSYEANIISNNNMIYNLLISTVWDEVTVTQSKALFQYFDILVYSA